MTKNSMSSLLISIYHNKTTIIKSETPRTPAFHNTQPPLELCFPFY